MALAKLVLAYDGTDFHGWARQPGKRTIEGEIVRVVSKVLGSAPRVSVAGRTDAGVHARGQVISFDASDTDPDRLQRVVNKTLGPELVVTSAQAAPPGFDARFSAKAREYCYRIDVSRTADPFDSRFSWHRPGDLRLVPMRDAASRLLGSHDFASFCRAPKDGGGTVRDLQRLSIAKRGNKIEVTARANAFAHQMVRSLVGTLVAVGDGRIAPGEMGAILRAKDRSRAGPVAPPRGLTLERVIYR